MHKCLITGAGGSIGVHVLTHLLSNTDWNFVITDSFTHKGYFDRVAKATENTEWRNRIELITHDLNAPFTERQLNKLKDVDKIINLASLSDVQDSIDDPVPFVKNNTNIILNILEAARTIKPDTFLHFSTDEVYGPADKNQGHEEWSTILPSNPYAASKAAQEAIAISYWRSYDVPVVITNTMNNFSTMQSASKYPVKVQKAVRKGEKVQVHTASDGQIGTRYYIDSRNAADAVLFLSQKEPTRHQPGQVDKPDKYNIVGDVQLDNLELAQTIAKLMGEELKYELVDFHSKEPGHDLHYGLDGTKLKEMGWEPPIPFEKAMKEVIDWQEENPEWISD